MASTLHLITELDFRSSRYAQVADQVEGDLSDIIAQAEAYIQRKVDRFIWKQTFIDYLKPLGTTLFLRSRPIISLTTIETRIGTGTWTTRALPDFAIDGDGSSGMVYYSQGSLAGLEVRVTYDAGYEPVPPDVKAAVILQTVIFAYQDLEVYGAGDSKKPGILYLQDQVNDIIKPYMRSRTMIL